jgi:hypothetical protein
MLGSHSANVINHLNMFNTVPMFEIVKTCPLLVTWMPEVWCV